MKRIVGLLIIMFFLTGCEATYNLEIEEDIFKEDIKIEVDNTLKDETLEDYGNLSYKELFDLRYRDHEPIYFSYENYNPYEEEDQEGVEYYKQEIIDNNINYGINYNYDFNIDGFANSKGVNSCYKEFSVQKYNDIYSLETNNLATCFDNYPLLDKLTINLKIDYRIIYQNADSNNDDIYTWIIDRDNYQNKNIRVSYTKSEELTEKEEEPTNPVSPNDPSNPNNPTNPEENNGQEEEENSIFDYILVGAIVLIFIVGILGYIKYKSIR